MTPDDLPFDVSEQELDRIFTQEIVPKYLEPFGTTALPLQALIIGGQPGSGKTRALARFAPPAEFTVVNGDDLRLFHPQYSELMIRQPELMPSATAAAAGAWIQMSLAWAVAQGRSVAWETTFRSGDALLRDAGMFATSGYTVTVIALAVPAEVSLLGTVERYCKQVALSGAGRSVSLAGHDEPFRAEPPLLQRLQAEVPGIRLRVLARDLHELFPGESDTTSDALSAGRMLTLEIARQLLVEVEALRGQVGGHELSASRIEAEKVLNELDTRVRNGITMITSIQSMRRHGRSGPGLGWND